MKVVSLVVMGLREGEGGRGESGVKMGVRDGEEKEEGGSSIFNSTWVYVGLCGSTWAQLGGPTWANLHSLPYLPPHTQTHTHAHYL